jgi:TolB protein
MPLSMRRCALMLDVRHLVRWGRMRPFRVGVLLALSTAAMVAAATSVQATPPGKNGQILFSGDAGRHSQLFTIRPDGTGLTQLTRLRGDTVQGAWSPDGTRIALERDLARRAAVYVMGADGAGLRQLNPRKFTFSGEPGWSPNGRLISLGREIHNKKGDILDQGLNVIAPSGRHFRKLTNGRKARSFDGGGSFSPDSKRIAFSRVRASKRNRSEPGKSAAIFTIGANGRGLKRLTSYSGDYANPSWSPDGTKILFHSYTESRPRKSANLFTVRPNGTGLTQLTHFTGGRLQAFGVEWSPDGTQIAYHKVGPGINDLFLLSADGTNERRLTRLGPKVNPRQINWGTRQG